jgi:hypothetical protein
MIIKSTRVQNGGGSKLGAHLGREDTNENVQILEGDLDQLISNEITSEMSGNKYGNRHFTISPQKPLSKDEIEKVKNMIIDEYLPKGLEGRSVTMVEHLKKRADGSKDPHFHLVISETAPEGGVICNNKSMARNEKLSRLAEFEFGHEAIKGAHNKAVFAQLQKEGKIEAANFVEPLTAGPRPIAKYSSAMQKKAERHGFQNFTDVMHQLHSVKDASENVIASTIAQIKELNPCISIEKGTKRDVLHLEFNGNSIGKLDNVLNLNEKHGKNRAEIVKSIIKTVEEIENGREFERERGIGNEFRPEFGRGNDGLSRATDARSHELGSGTGDSEFENGRISDSESDVRLTGSEPTSGTDGEYSRDAFGSSEFAGDNDAERHIEGPNGGKNGDFSSGDATNSGTSDSQRKEIIREIPTDRRRDEAIEQPTDLNSQLNQAEKIRISNSIDHKLFDEFDEFLADNNYSSKTIADRQLSENSIDPRLFEDFGEFLNQNNYSSRDLVNRHIADNQIDQELFDDFDQLLNDNYYNSRILADRQIAENAIDPKIIDDFQNFLNENPVPKIEIDQKKDEVKQNTKIEDAPAPADPIPVQPKSDNSSKSAPKSTPKISKSKAPGRSGGGSKSNSNINLNFKLLDSKSDASAVKGYFDAWAANWKKITAAANETVNYKIPKAIKRQQQKKANNDFFKSVSSKTGGLNRSDLKNYKEKTADGMTCKEFIQDRKSTAENFQASGDFEIDARTDLKTMMSCLSVGFTDSQIIDALSDESTAIQNSKSGSIEWFGRDDNTLAYLEDRLEQAYKFTKISPMVSIEKEAEIREYEEELIREREESEKAKSDKLKKDEIALNHAREISRQENLKRKTSRDQKFSSLSEQLRAKEEAKIRKRKNNKSKGRGRDDDFQPPTPKFGM